MGETSWLTRASVNGNTNIDHILDITEKLVQIGIRHLECKVANEEGLGWRGLTNIALRLVHVVDDKTAALQNAEILGLDGSSCFLDGAEFNISETMEPC